MNEELFEKYKCQLSKMTDSLNLKQAIRSNRKGSKKLRDYLVFFKVALQESLSYFAVVQTVLLFMALTPQAIENINGILLFLQIPITLDITFSSILTIIAISIIFLFGIVSYRFFGLTRSANEISSRYSPGQFLLFKELQEIKSELEKLKEEKP